jgi:hypothetical protein
MYVRVGMQGSLRVRRGEGTRVRYGERMMLR